MERFESQPIENCYYRTLILWLLWLGCYSPPSLATPPSTLLIDLSEYLAERANRRLSHDHATERSRACPFFTRLRRGQNLSTR